MQLMLADRTCASRADVGSFARACRSQSTCALLRFWRCCGWREYRSRSEIGSSKPWLRVGVDGIERGGRRETAERVSCVDDNSVGAERVPPCVSLAPALATTPASPRLKKTNQRRAMEAIFISFHPGSQDVRTLGDSSRYSKWQVGAACGLCPATQQEPTARHGQRSRRSQCSQRVRCSGGLARIMLRGLVPRRAIGGSLLQEGFYQSRD